MVYARLLLLMFCVGQYLAFAHTHVKQTVFPSAKHNQAVIKEHCDVCDAMQDTQALVSPIMLYVVPVAPSITLYSQNTPGFTPIQLVLAAGRAPPVAC